MGLVDADTAAASGSGARRRGFAAVAAAAESGALAAFKNAFEADLLVPGTPWDGKVRYVSGMGRYVMCGMGVMSGMGRYVMCVCVMPG